MEEAAADADDADDGAGSVRVSKEETGAMGAIGNGTSGGGWAGGGPNGPTDGGERVGGAPAVGGGNLVVVSVLLPSGWSLLPLKILLKLLIELPRCCFFF